MCDHYRSLKMKECMKNSRLSTHSLLPVLRPEVQPGLFHFCLVFHTLQGPNAAVCWVGFTHLFKQALITCLFCSSITLGTIWEKHEWFTVSEDQQSTTKYISAVQQGEYEIRAWMKDDICSLYQCCHTVFLLPTSAMTTRVRANPEPHWDGKEQQINVSSSKQQPFFFRAQTQAMIFEKLEMCVLYLCT